MRGPGLLGVLLALGLSSVVMEAQNRLLSPRGQAATQVGGHFNSEGAYVDGQWIDIDYGRPILRGRMDPFGGDPYGVRVRGSAGVWRLGADQSTRLMTETDLLFGGERLPAGEYSLFVDLAPDEWTLVFSSYGVKQWYLEDIPNALWGSFGYTPDKDVLRATMEVTTYPMTTDQLIIAFTDMTQQGGNLVVWWDDQFASTPFAVP